MAAGEPSGATGGSEAAASVRVRRSQACSGVEARAGCHQRDSISSTLPNGGSLDAYDNVNLGFEQTFQFAGAPNLKARFDIVNVFDQVYELRDGSGIGVGAAQYGQRRGFYAGITYAF